MTVCDAEPTLSRAAESVLNQDFDDVQLVLVAMPSRDHTRSMCARLVERDYRCDMIEVETTDQLVAYDAGVDAARGDYVLFMGQRDWLGARALGRLAALAREHDLQMVAPLLSIDATDARGELVSHLERAGGEVFLSASALRAQAYRFIEGDAFTVLPGRMLERARIEELGLRMAIAGSLDAYLIAFIEDVERIGIVEDAVFHLHRRAHALHAYDAGLYGRCERDHELLLALASRWGMEGDEAFMRAIHRRHVRQLITCIDNVCARRAVSSIERGERVRDMVEAPSTQRSIEALRAVPAHRDFGLMYDSIARKNVLACCVGVRILGMGRLPQLSLVQRNAAAL